MRGQADPSTAVARRGGSLERRAAGVAFGIETKPKARARVPWAGKSALRSQMGG